MSSEVPTLEFENGNLVKVNGVRPEYMTGYQMISLIRLLAKENIAMRHSIVELTGTIEEYTNVPVAGLRKRMYEAHRIAKERWGIA